MKTLREKDEENPDSDSRWWSVTECTIYDADGGKTVRTYYPGASSEYDRYKDCRTYDENGVETYYATYDEDGNVIEEYVDGELVGDDTGNEEEPPEDYEMSYENQGMIWTAYYKSGVLWKETVAFTDGTTIVVSEKDSLGRYVISYGYYAGDDGVMTMLEVYHYVYTGDAVEPTSQSWVQYNVPDVAVVDTSERDEEEEPEKFTGTSTEESQGLLWTNTYVDGECVKRTVTFADGTTIVVHELDELGRAIRACGYGAEDDGTLTCLLVHERTYVGDTEEIATEKMAEYSVPDGNIVREDIITG